MTKQHRDPVTGDELTTGEYVSWAIQGVIRRWTFLIVITLITVIAWSTNNSEVLTWWNLGASYLAIVIESIVGMAMFRQTLRDAVVSRETRAISKRIAEIEATNALQLEKIEAQMELLAALRKATQKLSVEVEQDVHRVPGES